MKRATIYLFFAIIMSATIYFAVKRTSKFNSIDFLENVIANIKTDTLLPKHIYFLSNNKSKALFIKTQFVMSPRIIFNYAFADIPKNSYILIIEDKNYKKKIYDNITKLKKKEAIFYENEFYQSFILKN